MLLAFSTCSQSEEEALQQLLDGHYVWQGEQVGNQGVGSVQGLQEGAIAHQEYSGVLYS